MSAVDDSISNQTMHLEGSEDSCSKEMSSKEIASSSPINSNSADSDSSSVQDTSDKDKNDDGQMNFDLIKGVNLDMYLPSNVINDMSDAEKENAKNRIDNWLHALKHGIQANFPTIIELTQAPKEKSKPRPKGAAKQPLVEKENRQSERLRILPKVSYNEEQTDKSSSLQESLKRPSFSSPSCSTSAKQQCFGSIINTNTNNWKIPTANSSQKSPKPVTEPAPEIPAYLQKFLKAPNLDNSQKSLIKTGISNTALHKYDIKPILEGKRGMDKILKHLEAGGCIFNKNLSDMCDELLQHISQKPLNILLVNPDMREGLAVSIVATFPQLAQPSIRNGDMPWTWLYDRSNNTGKLATVYRKLQQKSSSRPRGGGTEQRKAKAKQSSLPEPGPTSVDDLQLSNDTKFLRQLSPVDSSKEEILRLMTRTYPERKNIVSKENMPIGVILDAYVHLKSFQGEMIDNDFELGYPGKKDNMLKYFQEMIPKLIGVAKADVQKYPSDEVFLFRDESMNALLILSKFLPKPKRVHQHEAKMNPNPVIDDIFQVVPIGSNIAYEVTAKREKSKHPVQPYIIAVGSRHNLGRMYYGVQKNPTPLGAILHARGRSMVAHSGGQWQKPGSPAPTWQK